MQIRKNETIKHQSDLLIKILKNNNKKMSLLSGYVTNISQAVQGSIFIHFQISGI